MEMHVEPLGEAITKVTLIGRLDMAGAAQIDLKFSVIAGSEKKILVDMSQVDYLASIGIRTLVTGARTAKLKKGKMVLLNLQPNVENVLRISGVVAVLPVFQDLQQACNALASGEN